MTSTVVLGLNLGQKFAGSQLEYELSDMEVNILNVPLAPSSNNNRFEVEVFVSLIVPIAFGWEYLPPMEIHLKVNAGYTPKF